MIIEGPSIQVTRSNFWIIVFIYLSIFINSIVFFKEPFEFYFGYLIYIVLLPGFISKYGLNRSLFFIFLVLLITGIANVALNNNTFTLFFKVFTGLMLSYFFYYYVILEFNSNVDQLFKWYLKGAYIAAIIGLIQFISYQIGFELGYNYNWILNKWGVVKGGNFGIRINSIFGEPTHLGAVMAGAFFISLYNVIRKETYFLSKFQSVVIIVVYILSFSGLGQAGIFLSLIFLSISFGFIRYIFILIPVGIVLFNILYNNVSDFRERYQSTVDLFSNGKFVLGKTHGSSFILFNNYNVALENFKTNFLFGTGIGSHPVAFEKYSLAKEIKVYGFNLNSADANSMLLRLISETGLFGVLIFLVIIFKCYVRRDAENETYHWLISNAILIMILLNLFRQGHYFLNGFPFFVLLYYFNWASHVKYLQKPATLLKASIEE
ncbi:MAG: hypothetical protein ACXVNM_12865 [Bacteroidia bacterium]